MEMCNEVKQILENDERLFFKSWFESYNYEKFKKSITYLGALKHSDGRIRNPRCYAVATRMGWI